MTQELPFYREAGSGSTTLFLFHGAYGDGRYFNELSSHFAERGYRVITWDCPGYGVSPKLEHSSIETFADAGCRLVEELGTERNIVFGHSMGGLIVPRVAVQANANIVGVVLSASSPGFKARTKEDQERFLAERLDPIRDGQSVAEYAPGLLKTMMAPGASGPAVDYVFEVVSQMETEVFERSLTALTSYDGRPTLEQLKLPVLLIAGEKDTACPPAGMHVIESLLENPTFREMKGVGHYPFAENFDEYVAIIGEFLDGLNEKEG